MQFVCAVAAASYLLNENLIQFPALSGTQIPSPGSHILPLIHQLFKQI